jgi:hypothetical protein
VPLAPLIRDKGTLHSDIALGSKEYSILEHVHKHLLRLAIHGANFRYLLTCHLFTLQSRTFDVTILTQYIHGFCLYSWRSSSVKIPASEVRTRHRDHVSWGARISEVSIPLKWRTNSQTRVPSANISPEGFKMVRKFSRSYFAQVRAYETRDRNLQKSWNRTPRSALSRLYYRIRESFNISEVSRMNSFYPIPQHSLLYV